MSEVEIKNFLKFNGGGKQWKQVAEGTLTVQVSRLTTSLMT